jgi:hypothetical protein
MRQFIAGGRRDASSARRALALFDRACNRALDQVPLKENIDRHQRRDSNQRRGCQLSQV